MTETHYTFCRICEALCGLELSVENNHVTAIRPDDAHVVTQGFACVKGVKQHRLYGSPDRLKYPLKKVGSRFERISWEQAIAEIGDKVRSLRAEHGADSIAAYVGTAAGFGVLHPIFVDGFFKGLGSKNLYSSATQDCANKFAVARHMYGFPFTQPFPDIDRTRCLIIVGANPAVSKWSFLQVTNPIKRLQRIVERGGRVVFVDPRRTESAKAAGEHLFIRPGTDVFFYLSFLHELVRVGGVDRDRVERYMSGLPELETLAASWPPERTAEVTGIEPSRLRDLVRSYCDADGAALYSSTGVNMGGNGTLAFWLQECINAVSGNLDRLGGTLVGHGIFDFAQLGKRTGALLRDDRSRVGALPSVVDAFPGGLLADEILTPGPGQVRSLFVSGGNPLMTIPGSDRLKRAFEQLELLVALDILPSETAEVAHYALPCTSPLERPDLPFLFPLLLGLQSRPYLQATDAVVQPEGEQRDEATIYLDLARASGVSLFGSRIAQIVLEVAKQVHSRFHRGEQPRLPERLLLSAMLLATGHGTFGSLLRHRHGRLKADHRGSDFLGARVVTDDSRVHLAPTPLMDEAERLEQRFAEERTERRRLRLITRRAVTSHNSWTHNVEDFVARDRHTNYLYMHPTDARRIGLGEGDLADVSSEAGAVRVPVRVLPDLMPGTVALPHGWGHQFATGLTVASRTTGVNSNLLAADGPEHLDRVSGMARLTAIPVDVAPARGSQRRTWSGR